MRSLTGVMRKRPDRHTRIRLSVTTTRGSAKSFLMAAE
jgi:hypothetical protein